MSEACLARSHGDMRIGWAELLLAESESPQIPVIENQGDCADEFLCRYEGEEAAG